ncbi:MAG: hypothetical protein OQK04_02270 [Kangiellaceae bacterium]|nr:hypothetical protein [Kangiellaceae bacterium]MCW8997528.1 hypothetical protein [Kangiellaceae bacterium]
MKLLPLTYILLMPLSDLHAAEYIPFEFKNIMSQREVTMAIERTQYRVHEKLAKLPKSISIIPGATQVWRCGTRQMEPLPILIPEKRFFFYSSKKRETWTPITGEHKKHNIWAVDTN